MSLSLIILFIYHTYSFPHSPVTPSRRTCLPYSPGLPKLCHPFLSNRFILLHFILLLAGPRFQMISCRFHVERFLVEWILEAFIRVVIVLVANLAEHLNCSLMLLLSRLCDVICNPFLSRVRLRSSLFLRGGPRWTVSQEFIRAVSTFNSIHRNITTAIKF